MKSSGLALWFLIIAVVLAARLHGLEQEGHVEQLVQWVQERGGQLDVCIGRNSEGVRGLLATRAISKGTVLASIPASLAISLGSSQATAPELAVLLLREQHRARSRFKPYLATLPDPLSTLCAEALPSSLLPLLESNPRLLELVHAKQAWARSVASGQVAGVKIPLSRVVPEGRDISAREFSAAVCMVSSRALASPAGAMYLIPVIDMANHKEGSPHVVRWQVEGQETQASATAQPGLGRLELVAGADVEEGEEVTISYGPLRMDEAALFYGFPLTSGAGQPQRLCAVDHHLYTPLDRPGKHEWSSEWPDGSKEELMSEIERLQAIAGAYNAPSKALLQDTVEACQAEAGPDLCDSASVLMLQLIHQCSFAVEQSLRIIGLHLHKEEL